MYSTFCILYLRYIGLHRTAINQLGPIDISEVVNVHLGSLATTRRLVFLESAPTPLQSITCKQEADGERK